MQSIRSNRAKLLIAAIAFLFVAAVMFAAGSTVNTTSAAAPTTGEKALFDGGSQYVAHCNTCHGGDGRGNTPKGRKTKAGDLTKSSVSNAKGLRMIANGKGEMPSFKNKMSEDEMQEVMNYVRGFRR